MVEELSTVITNEFHNLTRISKKILHKQVRKKNHTASKKKIKLEKLALNLRTLIKNFDKMLSEAKNLLTECAEKSLELRESQMLSSKNFQFIHDGIKSVVFKEPLVEEKHSTKKHPVKRKIKEITEIYSIKTPKISVPIAANLNNIGSCIFWYNGDSTNPKGLYMSPCPKLYVKIPFMNVVDGTKDYNRVGSIKCKYGTKKLCNNNKRYISEKFNASIRECTYAHIGDRYKKIGMNYRSPGMPAFGRTDTLSADAKTISYKDIKIIMMYAVSDILLCHMWAAANDIKTEVVFSDVDICQ